MSDPTIVLDFSEEQKEQDCPLLYVEVPQGEIAPGDALEVRLWGPEELLQGWNLCAAHESLGPGRLGGLTRQEALYSQQLNLAAATVAPLEYPFVETVSVTALTPLVWVDPAAPHPPAIWQP